MKSLIILIFIAILFSGCLTDNQKIDLQNKIISDSNNFQNNLLSAEEKIKQENFDEAKLILFEANKTEDNLINNSKRYKEKYGYDEWFTADFEKYINQVNPSLVKVDLLTMDYKKLTINNGNNSDGIIIFLKEIKREYEKVNSDLESFTDKKRWNIEFAKTTLIKAIKGTSDAIEEIKRGQKTYLLVPGTKLIDGSKVKEKKEPIDFTNLKKQNDAFYTNASTVCLQINYQDKNYAPPFESTLYIGDKLMGETTYGCFQFFVGCSYLSGNTKFIPKGIEKYTTLAKEHLNYQFEFTPKKGYCDKWNNFSIDYSQTVKTQQLLAIKPYVSNIISSDPEIKKNAEQIIKDCDENDSNCKINTIFRAVVTQLDYNYDELNFGFDYIKPVDKTLLQRNGDCEDLSAVLNSYLENIGIKTFLILGETTDGVGHAYTAACGINTNDLSKYVPTDQNYTIYNLDNQDCVILDATNGKYGFIGNEANMKKEKNFINPKTFELIMNPLPKKYNN